MSFTSSLPANLIKYTPPGYIPIPYIIICGIEVRYVKNGDIISHDNRARIFNITTCLASRLLEWSRKIGLSK